MQNRANGTPALLRKNLNVRKADVEPWQGAEETYMRVGITCFISSFITYLIIRTIHNMVQFCVPFYYQLVSNVSSQIQPRFKPTKSPGHTMHVLAVVSLTPMP